MSERICKGENCDLILVDAFKKPINGYMYWCAECLFKEVVTPGYKYICHDCGQPFHDEIDIEEHWYDEHADSQVPGAKNWKMKP